MSRMQEEISQTCKPVYAGIDVGKRHLDIFISPQNIKLRVTNDKTGVQTLLRQCQMQDVRLAALEATGKYHRAAHQTLDDAGIPTAVINPFRSRQFADSLGHLAKTDTIDAHMLARFAELIKPRPTVPPSAHHKALRDLNSARRQVLQNIGEFKRQLQCTEHPLAAKQIRARLKMAERHKVALETELQALIQADPDLKRKFTILTSIPFIGSITAMILLSDLAELGRLNCKQIAALAGVAPMSWDSGAKHGNRMIRGGRGSVRNVLYMCAIGSSRCENTFASYYRRLIKGGKHPKVALTAMMRKLVILANTLITEDRCWQRVAP